MKSNKLLSLFTLTLLLISCGAKKNLRKSKELDKFVKTYKYVPFEIPRDGDGVGTLITYNKDGSEAVVAALSDCFVKGNLNIEKLPSDLPNYTYVLSKTDSVSIDAGKIFGDKVNLKGALKSTKVDSVKVEFKDVFQVRVTRITVEKELKRIVESNALCVEKSYDKNNYFIERVLGANEIEVSFFNNSGIQIPVDVDILNEIDIDNSFVKEVNGNSVLSMDKPRYIGYRLWSISGKPGFGDTPIKIQEVSNEKALKLKE
ncbi:hypothetical protein [Maribacter sp. 4G9]|uniref:hypothetical protein n=1 Tax=Maribacter sp. 4G9 TaxID=1889777 RepID=UPI000C4C7C54|nr:hypothetical protein [Maribacter sp. 4G9]PIB26444.1 hypothetical protein BFP75_08340 [Maribacter sp. 4G9]